MESLDQWGSMLRKRFHCLLIGAALVAAWAGITVMPASADGVLYNQSANNLGASASQNDTTGGLGNFATAYDNFTLTPGDSSTIQRVMDWIVFRRGGAVTGGVGNNYGCHYQFLREQFRNSGSSSVQHVRPAGRRKSELFRG